MARRQRVSAADVPMEDQRIAEEAGLGDVEDRAGRDAEIEAGDGTD